MPTGVVAPCLNIIALNGDKYKTYDDSDVYQMVGDKVIFSKGESEEGDPTFGGYEEVLVAVDVKPAPSRIGSRVRIIPAPGYDEAAVEGTAAKALMSANGEPYMRVKTMDGATIDVHTACLRVLGDTK